MKSDYTIDFDTNTIYLSRSFAEKARKAGTPENQRFLEYKKMYRGFSFQKREFKKNEKQNRYKGMTYDFMREYIKRHEEKNAADFMLAKLETLLMDLEGVSKDHCYPQVKHWFLLNYPELKEVGDFKESRPQNEESVEDIKASA